MCVCSLDTVDNSTAADMDLKTTLPEGCTCWENQKTGNGKCIHTYTRSRHLM